MATWATLPKEKKKERCMALRFWCLECVAHGQSQQRLPTCLKAFSYKRRRRRGGGGGGGGGRGNEVSQGLGEVFPCFFLFFFLSVEAEKGRRTDRHIHTHTQTHIHTHTHTESKRDMSRLQARTRTGLSRLPWEEVQAHWFGGTRPCVVAGTP